MQSSKIKPKIKIKQKRSGSSIDLRLNAQQNQHNALIINQFALLIAQTKQIIKQCTSSERRKHQFRLRQFNNALTKISQLPDKITSGAQAKKIDGIGKGIADRIDQILKTGRLAELHQKQEICLTPSQQVIQQLTRVSGIGEVHARKFYQQGILSVKDLQQKVRADQITVTHHMRIGLKWFSDLQERIPRTEIDQIYELLSARIIEVDCDLQFQICGSYRRHCPDSGDLDVLLTHPSIRTDQELIVTRTNYLEMVVSHLTNSQILVDHLTSQGKTKYMGICQLNNHRLGRRIDLRFVPYQSWFPAMLYFTGSKELNTAMRTIALKKGYLLNEYGFYQVQGKQKKQIVVFSEQEIFDLLDIKYLEPKERNL